MVPQFSYSLVVEPEYEPVVGGEYANSIPKSNRKSSVSLDFLANKELVYAIPGAPSVLNLNWIESGTSITGPSSSFNLLNFRAPLGNELESTFISPTESINTAEFISVHPAIVGSTSGTGVGGLLTTQSFHRPSSVDSIYFITYPSASAILPYSTTNTEVYFLDQPAAGLRNRVNNKIQIDDGQYFGNTLSSLRSIQQNYQISRSYTEDINSLEVSFSPQEEINDDIIQTFGFGVISDVLADPRFVSSSDDYYPGLRSIAKEYFEKYTEGNVYDYLRLINYFDNSIFKAIKNYVPARTSVSTGIVIKQHLLERNRIRPVQLSEVTKIAVTPEGGYNTPITRENLELTSSIEVGSFSGGTGGVLEEYNVEPTTVCSLLTTTDALLSSITQNLGGTGTDMGYILLGLITETGGGSGARATIQVSSGNVTQITIGSTYKGSGYQVGDTLRIDGATLGASQDLRISLQADDLNNCVTTTFSTTNQVCSGVYETVLGDVPYSDATQASFYNGELCGTVLTVTTQSLFNNPFTKPSTIEPFYSASVVNIGLRDYYSIPEDTVFEFIEGDPSITEIQSYVGSNMTFTTSSIVWVMESGDDWYITGLALAASSSNGFWGELGGTSSIFEIAYDHNDGEEILFYNPQAVNFRILPPENIFNVSYPYSSEDYRKLIPYITFPLPNITNGYSSSLGLSTQHITTFGLPLKDTTTEFALYDSETYVARIWTFNANDAARPIVRNDNSDPISEIIGIHSGSSGIKYISPTNNTFDRVLNFSNDVPSTQAGDIKMSLEGTTYQATSSIEMEYWYPNYIIINSNDLTGRNNAVSFALNPDISFDLTPLGALRNDGTGVNTDRVNTSLLTPISPPSFNLGGYLNIYQYIESDQRVVGGTRTNTYVTGSNPTLVAFDPYIDDTITSNFENSVYFATPNNYNQNRPNSYLMDIEYDNGMETPSNLSSILNRTATPTQTPDSNYTAKKVILPRYEGSKVSSVDYNFYTAASSSVDFINGDTGSWGGDKSYGKTAAIDKNPIYFAHFEYSWNNPVIFGMGEYFVDQLIEVPFNDIQGTPVQPKALKIEGNNSKLQEIVSTFEVNRDLSAVFESEIYEGVNYSTLKRTNLEILNPGSRYVITSGNQQSPTETSPSYSYSRFNGVLFNTPDGTTPTGSTLLLTGSGCFELSGSDSGGVGIFFFEDTTSPLPQYRMTYKGPILSILHTYNYCVANEIYIGEDILDGSSQPILIGVPEGIDKNDPASYFKLNPAQSSLPNYENDEQPFLIERGDEIRVTYTSGSSGYINQDFQVLGVEENIYDAGSDNPYSLDFYDTPSVSSGTTYDGGSKKMKLFNKINVYPDPSTLASQIPSGSIYSYTIRKRQDADNIVNVKSPIQPSGSKGAETYSGKGYLIPNDLTNTQKRNVQTLITTLKDKNAFKNDDTE